MKTKYILKTFLITILITSTVFNCGYNEDVIDELSVNREFAPVSLTARVRNQTVVELNWTVRDDTNNYVVEFSADDPNFNTIFKTVEVSASELPIQVQLEGLTEYSIRVKALSSNGLEDSTWAVATATTLSEQLMLPYANGDIGYNTATLKWQAGINVTHLLLQPGDITHTITEQEKAAGVATVTGLTSETKYTVDLFNNTKPRGFAIIKTEVDPSIGTVFGPSDNLLQMIANAASGSILLLQPGDYTAQSGSITLDKSITIRGLYSYDLPLLSNNVSIITGATNVNLIHLNLNGGATVQDVVRYSAAGNYNSLLIKGCIVSNYDRSFIAGNVTSAIVQTVTVEDCIVTNVITNGGDFIDFRNSDALNITVKTSTFNNCAPARDFFRIDAAGDSNNNTPLKTVNVLLENCTLYGVCNTTDRILYIRFNANAITVSKNIFAQTDAIYSNQSSTSDPVFLNNNYFNTTGLHTTNTKFDATTTFTTLDPGFVNAAAGDFTITNQTLKDNAVGDPRWRL